MFFCAKVDESEYDAVIFSWRWGGHTEAFRRCVCERGRARQMQQLALASWALERLQMNRRDCFTSGGAALLAGVLQAMPALAQSKYPERAIRLVVPYAPGGVVDAVARQWADKVREPLGTVIIENQGGGGGVVGAASVARSQPDGYTLLFGDTSSQIIAPSLMASPPYDAANDFIAVAMVATSSTAIVVHPSAPASNLADFIAYAKSKGQQLSYASAGTGTVTNLAGELFKQLIGTPDIVHVPYRGAGPGLTDLVSGVVPMMAPNITGQVLDLHRAGKVRILAVCSPARLKAAPEIPAANETLPGLVVQLACGVFAPVKTPDAVINQISGATAIATRNPAFVQAMEAAGLEVRSDMSSAGAREFLDAERQRLIPIIRAAGMKS
jgi:tripartite-type tricarboxylate transporter receptor subunit TctC